MTDDLETWHRLSPAMLLIHPVENAVRTLTQIIGLSFVGRSIQFDQWPLAVGGLLASMGVIRWLTTRVRVTSESVQLRDGLFVRSTLTTSRDRVRTVDITAPPMHRLLGVVRVVVGTGSNDTSGNAQLTLDGLSRQAAVALRDELLHRTAAPEQQETVLVAFDRSWMHYSVFSLPGLVAGVGGVALIPEISRRAGVDLETWLDGLREVHGRPLVSAGLVLVLLLLLVVTCVASYYLSYGNFRLVRHDAGTLQVTRGLLTSRTTSLELTRVVGAGLLEPLPVRALRGARAHALTTGLASSGSSSGGDLIVPAVPRPVAEAVVADVLGNAALDEPLTPHPPAALRRALSRSLGSTGALLAGGTVALLVLEQSMWWTLPAPGLLAAAAWLGRDRYRSLGHAVTPDAVSTRHGSAFRRHVVLDTSAVIGWRTSSTWFQRRLGLLTLTATTAAGSQGYDVVDCNGAQALAAMAKVSPHLVEQFAT